MASETTADRKKVSKRTVSMRLRDDFVKKLNDFCETHAIQKSAFVEKAVMRAIDEYNKKEGKLF